MANDNQPANTPTIDLGAAVRDAVIASLVMLGLAIPILALKTEQNMDNRLVLEPRWHYVWIACALVFAVRLALTLFIWNRKAKITITKGEQTPTIMSGLVRVLKPFSGRAGLLFLVAYP